MYYSEDEYPHDSEDLPSLFELLDTVDWEVLRVFDACRWDAFHERCAPVEPVRTPCKHTTEWVRDLWCNDEYDWSDVTYVSANPHVGNLDKLGFDVDIENHVKQHIPVHNKEEFVNPDLNVVKPRGLSRFVEQHDPPIVIHYMQPHNPFIGDVKLDFSMSFDDQDTIPLSSPETGSRLAHLVQNNHVSVEYYRLAYLKNLDYIWEHTQNPVFEEYNTITTADHGELLSHPFGHGETHYNRTTIVPFHTTWDVNLPNPSAVGAKTDYTWQEHSTDPDTGKDSQSENSENAQEDVNEDLHNKLAALGYRTE